MKVTYKVNNYTYGRIKNGVSVTFGCVAKNRNVWEVDSVEKVDSWHKQVTFRNVRDEIDKKKLDEVVRYKGVVLG